MLLVSRWFIGFISMGGSFILTVAALYRTDIGNLQWIVSPMVSAGIGYYVTKNVWFPPVVMVLLLAWMPMAIKDSETRLFAAIITIMDVGIALATCLVIKVIKKVISWWSIR